MAKKISAPLTKEEKRKNIVRRILLLCLLVSMALLFVELVDNKYTVEYHNIFDIVIALLGVVMIAEAVPRICRHAAVEGFSDYLKHNKAEFLWLIVFPIILVCSFLVPGMAGWRWLVALKMPNVFGRYNDENVFQIIVKIAAVLLILIFVIPFFNLVAVAISKPGQIVNLLPKNIDWEGFKYAVTDMQFLRSFKNSIFLTVVGTIGSVVVVSLAAYPLSKPQMPLKRTVMIFFMIVMYFGGGLAPMIILMDTLGLMDTIWALIIPGWMSVYNMLLMKGFYESLPPQLEEAAKIDGASNMYVFRKIIIPLSKPMVATIAFFQVVGYWNSYGPALYYISTRKDLYPVPNYIRNFMSISPQSMTDMNPTLMFYWNNVEKSYLLLSIIPIMCLYPFVFRFIKGGMATGAVKG